MFIAHIPAGYLATDALLRRRPVPPARRGRVLALGMMAAVLPDFDLLWFFLVDHRRTVHHAYLPHLPLAWVPVMALAAAALWAARAGRTTWTAWMVVCANVALHLVMDTTAGGIRWGWPFSHAELALAHVTARHDPWYLNFVLHWTFALEIAIVAAALALLVVRRRAAGGVTGKSPVSE